MATAITKNPFLIGINKKGLRPKAAVSKEIPDETFRQRTMRRAKSAAYYGSLFFVLLLVAGIFSFFYFYNHYSAIVAQRINSGFWHSRAGIYAGSIKLRKGQNLSQEKVVELLKRSGYVEGNSAEGIWNGTFTQRENVVEIRNNGFNSVQGESVAVIFAGNEISRISNLTAKNYAVESFEIEPELLSGRSETKRGKNLALKYEDIPENLRQAILTAEDNRFFTHYGIDPRGVARAFLKNLGEGEVKQGGSTITQQLVKNTFLSPERSFSRKFAEAFLAIALERQMSKEEIFTLYCNEIYLGQYGSNGVHGVEEASRAYFNKELKDLNLNEAAAIAAMIKNPNRFAPHKNAEQAANRRKWIISEMGKNGSVDSQTAQNAVNSELALAQPKLNDKSIAPYFVDSITKELSTRFDRDYLNTNFNTRVYSTIDTELQALAEQAVANQLAKLDKIYAKRNLKLQASLVSIEPRTGQVLAMVGGRNYLESQFNRVTDAKRQPGSVFKPFVYATAIENGKSPMNVYQDAPTKFDVKYGKDYEPANYGNSYTKTNITLKTALAKSSNIVAIKTALDTGLQAVANKAKEFGFDKIEAYPSIALGTAEVTPLQLAAAYATFANGGKEVKPTFVNKIVSGDGELLYLTRESIKQIVSPQTAYILTDMMSAVVARGTAQKANGALGKDLAFVGKTGSSKDGWFVGYTPNLVTVAWIGFDENEDINATGGEVALPLWTEYMKSVVETRPEFGGRSFAVPEGLMTVNVDSETGMLADQYCPHKELMIVKANSVSNYYCFKHRPLQETFTAEKYDTEKFEGENFSDSSDLAYYQSESEPNNQSPRTQQIEAKSVTIENSANSEETNENSTYKNTELNRLENNVEVKKPIAAPTVPLPAKPKAISTTENKVNESPRKASETGTDN
jgi:penicillin-binding protein 1B